MTIIALVVTIVVIGLIAWLINTYLPIPQPYKNILNVVLIIIAIIVALNAFGIGLNLGGDVPHLK